MSEALATNEERLCEFCKANPAAKACDVCGIALCDICAQEIAFEDMSPAYRVKGVSASVMKAAVTKKTVCRKCMAEMDVDQGKAKAAPKEAEDLGPALEAVSFKDTRKHTVRLGKTVLDIDAIVPDSRGITDMIEEIILNDWGEGRATQFDLKLFPFASWADLNEWDEALLTRHSPRYSTPVLPEDGKNGASDERRARESLIKTIKECMTVYSTTRELMNFAMKALGPEKVIKYGKAPTFADAHPILAALTGIYVKNLRDLEKVLVYGESQVIEIAAATRAPGETAARFEQMNFHAGSLIFLAMEIAELLKIACFGLITAADQDPKALADWPAATNESGAGNVNASLPILTFMGDAFLPPFLAVQEIISRGLVGKIEVCGIGPAGDDILRFYPKGRVLETMVRAYRVLGSGMTDVLVIGDVCMKSDIMKTVAGTGTRVIATSRKNSLGLPDRTRDLTDNVVKDLVAGTMGVLVLDPEKAAEIAVEVAVKLKREKTAPFVDVANLASKCVSCDMCTARCPNSIVLSGAMAKAAKGDMAELKGLEERCVYCGRCEEACRPGIPIRQVFSAVGRDALSNEKFIMRPGRGPVLETEVRAQAFSLVFGNIPGMAALISCGDTTSRQELGEMAREMVSRNCILFTAGCGAQDIAKNFSEKEKEFIFEEFGSAALARSLVNCGGCTSNVQILDEFFKVARLGGAVSSYANYVEMADYTYNRLNYVVVMWGVMPDRAYAMATGYARGGIPVVVGPTSGFEFDRYLLGSKHDKERWWMWDGLDGRKRDVEPAPRHLIFPAETKEEALTMAMNLLTRPLDLRDGRATHIETYIDMFQKFYKKFPDDWQSFVRSEHELPVMKRMKLLKVLREQQGWETDGPRITKARGTDGKLVDIEEYNKVYGIEQGRYATRIQRLITKQK
ncbi:MAG: dehydrogenase/acetyl-CoA synthase complex, epsilon subunit [Deltaproteobacteria bacterium]|nr:dehydrogenase/acetyl-CoA synthase complex, epsilon subunit [Deltaproteobacteria bacterium]